MAETVESRGGDRPCRQRQRKSVVAIAAFAFVVIVVVVVVAAVLNVGFDHHRAAVSLPLDETDLPSSLRNRLIELHARVISSMKGTLI